jgi:hypothetical protein
VHGGSSRWDFHQLVVAFALIRSSLWYSIERQRVASGSQFIIESIPYLINSFKLISHMQGVDVTQVPEGRRCGRTWTTWTYVP